MPKPPPPVLSLASIAVGAVALGLAAAGRAAPSPRVSSGGIQDAAKAGPTPGWRTAESCNLCHREDRRDTQKVTDFVKLGELDAWQKNDKHHDAFTVLRGERGKLMQDRLGWKDVASEPKCLSCHGPAAESPGGTDEAIAEGVSCLSCHGAYTEWVDAHGGVGDKAKQEKWIDTPAKVKHDQFGMTDLRDPAVRAEACASCHVGDPSKDRVVTHDMYAAGHPPLPGLEVSTFSTAEPPHWWPMKDVPYLNLEDSALMKRYGVKEFEAQEARFKTLRDLYHVDEFPTQQAKLVAVGGLVTFREAMELFAETGSKPGGIPDFARFDCAACHHDLAVSADSFRQARGFAADPGRPPSSSWPLALAYVGIEAGDPDKAAARRKELDDGIAALRKNVGARPFGDPKPAADQAAKLAAWADAIAKEIDARRLGRDDATRLLRAIAASPVPDHASARQLAWAFRAIFDEMKEKPANAPEITATLDQLTESLGVRLLPGDAEGKIERENGARLDADDKFEPAVISPLFEKLAALMRNAEN